MSTADPFELARAAGADAANRSMRAAGRTAWNAADYRLACTTLHALCPAEVRATIAERITSRTYPTHERLYAGILPGQY